LDMTLGPVDHEFLRRLSELGAQLGDDP